jgi:threonine dehydrogenase-like Zn-dependent dehydrogenase
MKAVTWHGKRDVRVERAPDPEIQQPGDVIVRITSTGICGSDLHLYEVLGPFMGEGDILGHEPMGIVEEVGSEVTETLDLREHENDLAEVIRGMTGGRGPDAVIDAVGMEAHGSPGATIAQQVAGVLPKRVAATLMQRAGVDRLNALYLAIDIVRRGGTISVIGVYGGMTDPLPLLTIFDKQIQLRMGQANVKRWVNDILPLLTDGDPLGVEGFATHTLPLDQAPQAYEMFQKKQDGAIKILLQP